MIKGTFCSAQYNTLYTAVTVVGYMQCVNVCFPLQPDQDENTEDMVVESLQDIEKQLREKNKKYNELQQQCTATNEVGAVPGMKRTGT